MPGDEVDHPQTSEALRERLTRLAPAEFAAHHILDRVPYLFESRTRYIEWKAALATDLSVDPHNIVVVGSAGVGFSLSPDKGLSAFHPRSDVDTAVVSSFHFETAWRVLRDFGPIDLLQSGSTEHGLVKYHRSKLLYDGSIAVDRLLPHLPFSATWATGLARAADREPTVGRDIKVRVYRDFESLRTYQMLSVRRVKAQALVDSD